MKFRYFQIFVVLLILLTTLPCSAYAENYFALRQDYQQLMKSSQAQRQRNNWEKLIVRFDDFITQHPRDGELEKALFLRA
ncbi:MAG: hypothetical protein V2I50_14015, partial [Desulfuromusa sp.]|nr:hypothetical protein [Desulfuromusa sp.]